MLSDVEISLIIKISVTHIGSRYFLTDGPSVLLNTSREVIFWFATLGTKVEVPRYSIIDIFKFDVTQHLMVTGSNQGVAESVILIIKLNASAISKLANFIAADLKVYGVEISLNSENRIPVKSVRVVWSFHKQVTYWWMVTDLLNIDHGAIG